jgi:hypothetical protein
VNPLHEQLKEKNGQGKLVNLLTSSIVGNRHALKLRRDVLGQAHRTYKYAVIATVVDLKRVAINENDTLPGHEDVPRLQIVGRVPFFMEFFYSFGQVNPNLVQSLTVQLRLLLFPPVRKDNVPQRDAIYTGHQVPCHLTVLIYEDLLGPSEVPIPVSVAPPRFDLKHGLEFLPTGPVPVIENLRRQIRAALHPVYRALSTLLLGRTVQGKFVSRTCGVLQGRRAHWQVGIIESCCRIAG